MAPDELRYLCWPVQQRSKSMDHYKQLKYKRPHEEMYLRNGQQMAQTAPARYIETKSGPKPNHYPREQLAKKDWRFFTADIECDIRGKDKEHAIISIVLTRYDLVRDKTVVYDGKVEHRGGLRYYYKVYKYDIKHFSNSILAGRFRGIANFVRFSLQCSQFNLSQLQIEDFYAGLFDSAYIVMHNAARLSPDF